MRPVTARLFMLLCCIWWYTNEMRGFIRNVLPSWKASQDLTWSTIQQLQGVRNSIPPGARLVYLNDVSPDWDTHFITELVLKDRTARITIQPRHDHVLSSQELAEFDTLLVFENGILRIVRTRA